ncbi:UNVERIFIED_CONTAM: hypothetical protein GTU68_040932 [Idotea baltica]|nr:hypothetical protein [Idotea baltica]
MHYLTYYGNEFLVIVSLVYIVYNLIVFIPGVSVRRLHDTNRSGWWVLLLFIPIVGTIALLVFFTKKSDPTENSFGAISTL